jgi:hypothetical protein
MVEMFDDVLAQVVAYGVGIPSRSVQEALCPLRPALSHSFGHLPAVPALHASEKASEVAPCSLPDPGLRKRPATRVCNSLRASGHRSMAASSPLFVS